MRLRFRRCILHVVLLTALVSGAAARADTPTPPEELLTDGERAWLAQRAEAPEYLVDLSMPSITFDVVEGEPTGILTDFMKELEARLGITFRVRTFDTWADLYTYALDASNFVIVGLAETPERTEKFLFTDHAFALPYVVMARPESPIDSMSDLRGQRVCTVSEYAINDYLRQFHPGIEPVHEATTLDALRSVIAGHCDAAIVDQLQATWLIDTEFLGQLRFATPSGYVNRVAIATSPNDPELMNIVSKALNDIPLAQRRAIVREHLGTTTPMARPRLVAWLAGGLLVAGAGVIALTFWTRSWRRVAEQRDHRLRESEAHLREAQRVAHIGSFEGDVHSDELWWSDELYHLFGQDPARYTPTKDGFFAFVHPDEVDAYRRAITASLTSGRPFVRQFRARGGNGAWRTFETIANVTYDASGTISGMRGTVQDITERRRTENALLESNLRLAQVSENIDDIVWLCEAGDDGAYRVLYVNPAFQTVFGVPVETIYARAETWSDAIVPEDRNEIRATFLRFLRGEGDYNVEFRIQRPDGSVRTLAATGGLIHTPDGGASRVAGLARDITDQKLAEEQRRTQMETQDLLLRELDHRVRNNITSLLSLINLSRVGARTIDELADAMYSRTEAIASIHTILADAQWRGGDLETMLRAIIHPVHRVQLVIDGPPTLVPLTQAQALGLVFNELTTNSAKYGALSVDGGSVTIRWTTDASTADGETQLTLDWQESGGPPVTDHPRPGTGTNLMLGLIHSELRGDATLRYETPGVHHTLHLTLTADATAQFATLDRLASGRT